MIKKFFLPVNRRHLWTVLQKQDNPHQYAFIVGIITPDVDKQHSHPYNDMPDVDKQKISLIIIWIGGACVVYKLH